MKHFLILSFWIVFFFMEVSCRITRKFIRLELNKQFFLSLIPLHCWSDKCLNLWASNETFTKYLKFPTNSWQLIYLNLSWTKLFKWNLIIGICFLLNCWALTSSPLELCALFWLFTSRFLMLVVLHTVKYYYH